MNSNSSSKKTKNKVTTSTTSQNDHSDTNADNNENDVVYISSTTTTNTSSSSNNNTTLSSSNRTTQPTTKRVRNVNDTVNMNHVRPKRSNSKTVQFTEPSISSSTLARIRTTFPDNLYSSVSTSTISPNFIDEIHFDMDIPPMISSISPIRRITSIDDDDLDLFRNDDVHDRWYHRPVIRVDNSIGAYAAVPPVDSYRNNRRIRNTNDRPTVYYNDTNTIIRNNAIEIPVPSWTTTNVHTPTMGTIPNERTIRRNRNSEIRSINITNNNSSSSGYPFSF